MSSAPTIFVVFGATGDLMKKKIVPALFRLYETKKLPAMFKIVGISKDDISQEGLKNLAGAAYPTDAGFLKLFSYHRGFFENLADYRSLDKYLKSIDDDWGVCANKLFYIASSPQFYEIIFKNLSLSKLTSSCSDEEGWTRVIVEKPFGKDLKTARNLERVLNKLFKEIQIYRIDHYLAKEVLQNILVFRFSNNLFENNWGNKFIEKIEVRLMEESGVEDRGGFYDGIGALQDVGQNHLLQMLALTAMENPVDFNAETIREKRAEILKTLIPPRKEEIAKFTFRAQYDGYRKIDGVKTGSTTETYFRARGFLSSGRWQNVPIIFESGKKTGEQRKEIIVHLKHPTPCLCPGDVKEHYKNKIIFSLEPLEGVTLQLWKKKPGLAFAIEQKDCLCPFHEEPRTNRHIEDYEKLLYDCIIGDQTLFVSSEEVEAMWKFIDPIIGAWRENAVPLNTYAPGTNRASIDSKFIDDYEPHMQMKKEIGIVGLGKMGKNMAVRLSERGWKVLGFDRAHGFEKLVSGLTAPRVVWLMVPAGKPVDEVIFGKSGLVHFLNKGDIIIDGGNSFYSDSIVRYNKLKKAGINFIDVGISGGPEGARHGSSIMVGGEKSLFTKLEPLFYDLSKDGSYQFFDGIGAGHFIKMVHNGIEYGMMQAIAEGFTILKKAKYKINLSEVAKIYNQGSVIDSRLIGWLQKALELHGDDLSDVTGSVARSGEGDWTVKTAQKMKLKTKVIKEALKFRIESEKKPSYTGKVVSALREQFGGHKVTD